MSRPASTTWVAIRMGSPRAFAEELLQPSSLLLAVSLEEASVEEDYLGVGSTACPFSLQFTVEFLRPIHGVHNHQRCAEVGIQDSGRRQRLWAQYKLPFDRVD